MRFILLLPVLFLRFSSCSGDHSSRHRINTDSIFAMQRVDSFAAAIEVLHIERLQHLRDSMHYCNFRYVTDPQFGNAYIFNSYPDDLRLHHTGIAVGVEPDGKLFLVSSDRNPQHKYNAIRANAYNCAMQAGDALPQSHPWSVKSSGAVECLTFRNYEATSMVHTIAEHRNENIYVTLLGDSCTSQPYSLRPDDKFAIAACDTFALVLRQLNSLDPVINAVRTGD